MHHSLGFAMGKRVHGAIKANRPETAMNVRYRGKIYEVAYTRYLGRDSDLYGLKSRFSGGAVFPAKKRACRPIQGDAARQQAGRIA